MMTLSLVIAIQDCANCPGGAALQEFQVLSKTWTGAEAPWGEITDFLYMGATWESPGGRDVDASRLWLAYPRTVVGWQGNPGERAPVHVVRVVALPTSEVADGPLDEHLLYYGGDAGVRVLDDPPTEGEGLPPGQGYPYLTLPASAITALPAEVQAVVRQRLCARCGEESGESALCPRCEKEQWSLTQRGCVTAIRNPLEPVSMFRYLGLVGAEESLSLLRGDKVSTELSHQFDDALDEEVRDALRRILQVTGNVGAEERQQQEDQLIALLVRISGGDAEARAELLRLAENLATPEEHTDV